MKYLHGRDKLRKVSMQVPETDSVRAKHTLLASAQQQLHVGLKGVWFVRQDERTGGRSPRGVGVASVHPSLQHHPIIDVNGRTIEAFHCAGGIENAHRSKKVRQAMCCLMWFTKGGFDAGAMTGKKERQGQAEFSRLGGIGDKEEGSEFTT